MTRCDACTQNMLDADGCIQVPVRIGGTDWNPIRYGQETMFNWTPEDAKLGRRCHDCNVRWGAYHHPNCDMEECPKCHGQLISCGCLDNE